MITSCLASLAETDSPEASRDLLAAMERKILRVPGTGADLTARLGAAQDDQDQERIATALEHFLAAARMDQENGGVHGAGFTAAVEQAIARLAADGRLSTSVAIALGRCYIHADLPPPPLLRVAGGAASAEIAPDAVASRELAAGDFAELDTLLRKLSSEARNDAYSLHAMLREMTAAADPAVRMVMIAASSERAEPCYERVACYWLLDQSEEVRRIAAGAILRRARSGSLDAAMADRLVEIRPWLPGDPARALLDQAIKETSRRETGGVETTRWTAGEVFVSLPDGSGAMTIAVSVRDGARRAMAMLLLKQGFGVKDAYLLSCRNAAEQKQLLARITDQVELFDATLECLEPFLAAALAENVAAGQPPAHGLIDIAEIRGLRRLRPEPMDVGAWIARLDPDGALAGLSAQALTRRLRDSADWPDEYEMLGSWFESGAIEEALRNAASRRAAEKLIWEHLETRRHWWALLMARSAATVHADQEFEGDAWKTFAAAALALANGRPLRKIPVMTWIMGRTLYTAASGIAEDMAQADAEPAPEIEVQPPAPEKKGELARLLAETPMTPAWLDGYLAAVVVAAKLIHPSEWAGELLNRHGLFASQAQAQRFLDILLHRYNAWNQESADVKAARRRMEALSGSALSEWAGGFCACVEQYRRAWNGGAAKKDDKTILRMLAAAAKTGEGETEIKPLLPAWLSARRAKRAKG